MYFEETLKFRLTNELVNKIEDILNEDQGEKYDNLSHFIRCAVIRLVREENTK